jgi:hypothetical protein
MLDGWPCHCCGLLPEPKMVEGALQREHGIRGKVTEERTVKIQTLFTGPKRAIHYFCVTNTGRNREAA